MLMNESKAPLKQIPHFGRAHFSFLHPKKILLVIIFEKKNVFTKFSSVLEKKTSNQYKVNEMHPLLTILPNLLVHLPFFDFLQ